MVQLYVSDMNGTPDRPVKELKGFAKVALGPGETMTVALTVDARSLSYYEERLGDWFAPSGKYGILVGDSSDNIAVCGELAFTTRKVVPLRIDGSVTIGELLANAATAPVVQQMMKAAAEQSPIMSDSADLGDGGRMMEAMMRFMPLKSLKSFGMMDDAKLEGLMAVLKQALGR